MKITLKALRINADLTQDEAASKLGVSRVTLQNWEANRTFPNISHLTKMCQLYDCTLDDVFIPSSLAKSE